MARKQSTPIPESGIINFSCFGAISNGIIKRIVPSGSRFAIRDTRHPGLVLRVGVSGRKTWCLDYRNEKGKRQRFAIGPTTIYSTSDARRKAQRVNVSEDPAGQKRAAKQAKKQAESRTLEAFLDGAYRVTILNHRKSGEATYQRIRSAFKPFIKADLSKLDPKKLTAHQQKKLDAGGKPATLNRERVALLALVNEAVHQGLIDQNPIIRWRRWKVEDEQRIRFLGPEEREQFKSALKDQPEWFRVLVFVALNTGLRRGELLGLTWGRVDLRRGQLTVSASTTKTNKVRHVALNTAVIEVLKVWRGNVVAFNGDSLVWPSQTGREIVNIKRRWKALCDQANVEDFRFHDCRHDFASRLVQSGVDLYQVKGLLGHQSITQTERYAHLAPDHQKAAVERLV